MGDRRALLGTGVVLVGVGSALLSGGAVASADTTDPDTAGQSGVAASETSAPAPATSRRGSAKSGPATTPRALPAAAGRGGRRVSAPAAAVVARQSNNTAIAPDVSVAPTIPAAQTPSQPGAALSAPAAATVSVEPAAVSVSSVAKGVTTPRAARIANVATPSAVARSSNAPATAPVTALVSSALSALGWSPATDLLTGLPMLAAWTGSRQTASAVAVAPASVVAAAPPDPTPEAALLAAALADPLLPGATNGVTGVQIGHSRLKIPGAFIGNTVAADWYFPTQSDGTVDAQGVIWLQHGFGATNTFYSALAQNLAQQTNSIVVAPTLSFIPFTFSGGCLTCSSTQKATAAAFLDPDRTVLVNSAEAAGYKGDVNELLGKFVLSGHSAGGGFATATAADYVDAGTSQQDANLAGVVMFDGVSNGAIDGSLQKQLADLAGVAVYQIAAPAQSWNLFGATTNVLASSRPDQFVGVVLAGGSHVDSMLGVNPIVDAVLQLVTKRVPAGNTAATYALSGGWINDLYGGHTAADGQYGLYTGANEQIIMGPTTAFGLPSPIANQMSVGDKILRGLINGIGGLFGFALPAPVNSGNNGVSGYTKPALSNGVTGVKTGSAVLDIPCGPTGYAAPAKWYFPTQGDGTVQANGIIWLQHGFLGFNDWYSTMAQTLAEETNSIVVAPNIFWFNTPICPGCYLSGPKMQEAVATMFDGTRSALNASANAAGLQGPLPEDFILTGHSAGGNFATSVGAKYISNLSEGDLNYLKGVVMFDGVSQAPLFTDSLDTLIGAGVPDYQIAAPPQAWNAYGTATELMYQKYADQFYGVQIDNGSHTDVLSGTNFFGWLGTIASGLIVKPSPAGAKSAVRTFATGWINDIYSGVYGPTDPFYGIYGRLNDGTYVPNQPIVMGDAGATTLPAPPPVDVAQYVGKWYELGSVKLPFEWGLVNTTATYSLNTDGSIKVQNAGNLFGPNGPLINIVGSAVPVNDFDTRLNVGFFFGKPGGGEPGNYWILDYDPDYSWAIVSDPTGFSGYILSRSQTLPSVEYQALVARARELGVWGPITRTAQYPV